MTEVIEHIQDDLFVASLREVDRLLKIDGRFIVTIPYMDVLHNNEVFCPNCGSSFHQWGHLHSRLADSEGLI